MSAVIPSSAAAERNKAPILAVLGDVLPARGEVLEIASGTGQHIVHFAAALPELRWQPSDPDPARRAAITARLGAAALVNVAAPQDVDVLQRPWPLDPRFDAVLCINMIHIAPEAATEALLAGARESLRAGGAGLVILYGPFVEDGRHTAASNATFDASLRADNPVWGVRDLGEVTRLARRHGFARRAVRPMPAHNLTVVFALEPATVDGEVR